MQVCNNITLDINKPLYELRVWAKSGDVNARTLRVTLVSDGIPLIVPNYADVVLGVKYETGSKGYRGSVNDDGSVSVVLPSELLTVGKYPCDISIINDGERVTTQTFNVVVDKTVYDGTDITEDDNYNVLTSLINDARNSSNILLAKIEGSNNTFTCNKSLQNIIEAIDAGKLVVFQYLNKLHSHYSVLSNKTIVQVNFTNISVTKVTTVMFQISSSGVATQSVDANLVQVDRVEQLEIGLQELGNTSAIHGDELQLQRSDITQLKEDLANLGLKIMPDNKIYITINDIAIGNGIYISQSQQPDKILNKLKISYVGGNVKSGTNVSELTGFDVVAIYSDNTVEKINNYTLKGDTIKEGRNEITLIYYGFEKTFEVFGFTIDENIEYILAEPNDFSYAIVGNTIYLRKYTGTKENLEIPSVMTLNTNIYNVSIWASNSNTAGMFKSDILKNIKFNNDIQIYQNALPSFNNATVLESIVGFDYLIDICNSVSLDKTFNTCENLKYIPDYNYDKPTRYQMTFWNCTNLKDVRNFKFSKTSTYARDTFANNTSLEYGCVIPENITDCCQMFYGCPKIKWFRVETLTASCLNNGSLSIIPRNLQNECTIELYKESIMFSELKTKLSEQSYANTKVNVVGINNDINSISCFGDSLTMGQNVVPNYPTVLRDLVPGNFIVYNHGLGGASMENIKERMGQNIDKISNGIVIIWAGTNGSAATQTIESRLNITDEMISMLGTNKYIIMSPIKTAYSKEIDDAYVERYGEHYFSIHDEFLNNGGLFDSNYMTDSTHFNQSGNRIIAECVYKKINELGYI